MARFREAAVPWSRMAVSSEFQQRDWDCNAILAEVREMLEMRKGMVRE